MPDEQISKVDQSTALILADQTQSVDLYRNMCAAIAECARIDQVQEIRNRAIALEEYTRQSKNFEAEAQVSGIRLRAERRVGELLSEMAEKGERAVAGRPQPNSNKKLPLLSELGISKVESSRWQQLASIPEPEFEKALAEPGVKHTGKVIAAYRSKRLVAPLKKPAKAAMQLPDEGHIERSRRLVCDAAIKLADGKVYTPPQICELTGHLGAEQFLRRARMLPWLTINRTSDGFSFSVDEELRLICEDRAPRPQLNNVGVHTFIKRLAKEIDRKRKENCEKQKAIKWNPDNVSKIEQKRLLDWVEMELQKLLQLMASSGPDYYM